VVRHQAIQFRPETLGQTEASGRKPLRTELNSILRRGSFFLTLAFAGIALAGCEDESEAGPVNFSGNPSRGATLIKQYQCGGCHEIPKISDATGNVGPPLQRIGTRTYIAGFIHNSPDNMTRWILDPQAVLPGNAMPRTGVTPDEARDITAFLYTLK
jgi:cytochrome c